MNPVHTHKKTQQAISCTSTLHFSINAFEHVLRTHPSTSTGYTLALTNIQHNKNITTADVLDALDGTSPNDDDAAATVAAATVVARVRTG